MGRLARVTPAACVFATVVHRRAESATDHEYVDLFFVIDSWAGEPRIAEPNKCTELVWVDPAELPTDTVDYVRAAVAASPAGRPLLLYGW